MPEARYGPEVLGKTVTVTVGRPLGSRHPRRPDIYYGINCGYVDGVMGGDGHAQDAYILGVDVPVKTFTGVIIAVGQRQDDAEDKWVVAPAGSVFYKPEIAHALHFVEQYFDTKYICLYEKCCGAVTYTENDGTRRYLIIKNESGHIGFPKGHVEYGECEEETALREIFEETGLRVGIDTAFRHEYDYIWEGYIHKKAVYFLAAFTDSKVITQENEIFGCWLVPYAEALALLNMEQDRTILKAAQDWHA